MSQCLASLISADRPIQAQDRESKLYIYILCDLWVVYTCFMSALNTTLSMSQGLGLLISADRPTQARGRESRLQIYTMCDLWGVYTCFRSALNTTLSVSQGLASLISADRPLQAQGRESRSQIKQSLHTNILNIGAKNIVIWSFEIRIIILTFKSNINNRTKKIMSRKDLME